MLALRAREKGSPIEMERDGARGSEAGGTKKKAERKSERQCGAVSDESTPDNKTPHPTAGLSCKEKIKTDRRHTECHWRRDKTKQTTVSNDKTVQGRRRRGATSYDACESERD